MKDFPLNELLSATDLDKISSSSSATSNVNFVYHPTQPSLVKAVSRDFNDRLPHLCTPYDTFERLLFQAQNIFQTWDERIKEFTNVARGVTRKRNGRFIPIKITLPTQSCARERDIYGSGGSRMRS
jgi:hypothetical protein